MSEESVTGLLEAYLRADAPQRAAMFKEFVSHLKAMAVGGDIDGAVEWARRAVSIDLDYSSHLSLRKILQQAPESGKEALRIAVLGGPTTTQFVWLLQSFLQGSGVAAEVFEGEYGLFRQSILMPDPGLDAFRPQIVFLATNARDLPETALPATRREELDAQADEEAEQWRQLWRLANERWGCQIIQNLFDCAPGGVLGHYAHKVPGSRECFIARLNRALVDAAPEFVLFHDQQMLALELGARQWFDPRYYLEAKMPCGPECLPVYAHSVASVILAAKGKSKKVLVLDLDNTLWGGVVGDDGIGGIRMGQGSAEGESYLAFQKYAKALSQRGILLAVCSKNDENNAREPFEKLPEMALKLDDFSSFVANWNNKADNLRAIAAELNLGLDSFVFVDDNPAERALVRQFLPQVAVPDMPTDAADYVQALARHRYFEPAALTDEDLKRSEYYRQDRQRRQLATAHTDINAFLQSLEMEARVEPIGAANIERSTQLINKSNQFNLTTRRYTLAEIKEKSESPDWLTLTISLRDKMGDNGLISVLLAEQKGRELVIDTWVMSCRVLQRGVEALAVETILKEARKRGCERVLGCYIPTAKNRMVAGHYAGLGFTLSGGAEGSTTHWARVVERDQAPARHHIRVIQAG